MGAELRIDGGEARALAERIAQVTGDPINQGVLDALRAYLSRVEREQLDFAQGGLRQREDHFYRVIEGSRERWPDFQLSVDHGDILYDEYGVPR